MIDGNENARCLEELIIEKIEIEYTKSYERFIEDIADYVSTVNENLNKIKDLGQEYDISDDDIQMALDDI